MRVLIVLSMSAMLLPACNSEQVKMPPVIEFRGQCDASAAIALDTDRFVVADDEDNVLRVYGLTHPGVALSEWDAGRHVLGKGEVDIEGGCRIDKHLFFITSHGRNRKGEDSPERQRLFALDFTDEGRQLRFAPVGKPYTNLLADLIADPRFRQFRLDQASKRAPKDRDALNIEGLCASPTGELLIGFRNPIPDGKALLVPLRNPQSVIEGCPADFGDPVLLELGGLGIRDLTAWGDKYLIIAGPAGGGSGQSRLYVWSGRAADPPSWIEDAHFRDFNPEAILIFPDDDTAAIYLLSDDGRGRISGRTCKDLKPKERRFRAMKLDLRTTAPTPH